MTPTIEIELISDRNEMPKEFNDFEYRQLPEKGDIDEALEESVAYNIEHLARKKLGNLPSYGLPKDLEHISKAISEAQFIPNLQNDWDDNNALKIPTQIFERAIQFVKSYALFLYDKYGFLLVEPSIMPVPDGSIDISWNTPNASLLICIKNQQDEVAYYYGEFFENDQKVDSNGQIPTNTTMASFANSWLRNIQKLED